MKRLIVLLCAFVLTLPAFLFAQNLGPWGAAYGEWVAKADGRLYQMSTKAGMAQAYMMLPQRGIVQYEFDVKYVDGAQDGYAAFGVHIGIDRAAAKKSWGNGESFLLWLTYDPNVYGGSGAYAQAYQSKSNSSMGLVHEAKAYMIPAERLAGIYLDELDRYVLPVKIKIDYDNGWVKVYDPVIPNYYYRFSLGGPIENGMYVAVRTSSLAASFGGFKVTQLDKF